MKILLLGKNGQVGWELERTLAPLGKVIAMGRKELDLADFAKIRETVRETKPNLIVNAAAYTAVDRAEEEQELAMAINGTAPGILAEEAKRVNAGLIHYSTDYVFDGTKTTPYTEEDEPNPINVYGKTKLAGERAIKQVGVPHLIFRTSWVYGLRGSNFLMTILRLAQEREELRVVDDQVGAPTWSRMIAEATAQILAQGVTQLHPFITNNSGIYHLTASGSTSWHGFAKAILELNPGRSKQLAKVIEPIATSEYPALARRPGYSVLSNAKQNHIFRIRLPEWDYILNMALFSGEIIQ